MKTLYFDCFAGASGDMIIGALIDLGVDPQQLSQALCKLHLEGYTITTTTTERCQIQAVKFDVHLTESDHHRHDHHQKHHHKHRGLREIQTLIERANLSQRVKEQSLAIFQRLAEAEGRVHGLAPEEVHFHEVGAVDAIVDVVGACIGFEMLGIERFICSPMRVGYGYVRCAHGLYPIPAPGTCELLKGLPIYAGDLEGEFVTPTGAAIISTLCSSYGQIAGLLPTRTGYGAGNRTYSDFPNVLRLILAEDSNTCSNQAVVVIEANLDDCNPQVFGYLMEKLFEAGALDVYYTPVQMKKSRPGILLTALAERSCADRVADCVLRETTTIGLRYYEAMRRVLDRRIQTVATKYGAIDFKLATDGKTLYKSMPEYRDCAEAARLHNVPLIEVQREAFVAFEELKGKIS